MTYVRFNASGMNAWGFLLIFFISLSAGCLQGEKGIQETELEPVREVIGTEVVSPDLGHAHTLAVSSGGEVFLGLHDGIAVSYDGGKTWRKVEIGKGELEDFMAISIDPKNPNLIYAGGHGHGVWGSDNYGKTWKLLANGLPPKPDIHALAVDPLNTQVIYAMVSGDEMYKSTDGGAEWTRVVTGLDTYAITSIAIDPEDTKRLYVGGIATGVLISEDGGMTWREAENFGNLDVVALVADNKGVLYAGTKGGVFKSEDKGESWIIIEDFQLAAFGLNPVNQTVMLVVTKEGDIYRSENEGLRWIQVFKAPLEEKGHYHGPVEEEEEELILIAGPAESYRPLTWDGKGIEQEGYVTDPAYAQDADFDDTTTYATVRAQGCESSYAAAYEWLIKKGDEQPILYYHWNFTMEVDRASIGAYDFTKNDWEEIHAIIDFYPMKKRSLRIPEEYVGPNGEVKLFFEVLTPCTVGVLQLYDVYLSVPE